MLGRSEAEGLYGEEAPGISRAMLNARRGGQNVLVVGVFGGRVADGGKRPGEIVFRQPGGGLGGEQFRRVGPS